MKQIILNVICDLCSDFLYYDRKEDEELNAAQLNNAVKSGEITKKWKETFLQNIEEIKNCEIKDNLQPIMIDSLKSQIETLDREIAEYEQKLGFKQ